MSEYRYETKIRCARNNWLKVWQDIERVFQPKEIFYERLVESIYFDDTGLSALKDNISGIANRNKYRIRRYIPTQVGATHDVVFEIKQKSNKLGTKHKFPIHGMFGRFESWTISEIQRELFRNHSTQLYSLNVPLDIAPVALIKYRRRYFQSDDVVITVDKGLQVSKAMRTQLPKTHHFSDLDCVIAEFKFNATNLSSFSNKINHTHISLGRCSKYALAHAHLSGLKYF